MKMSKNWNVDPAVEIAEMVNLWFGVDKKTENLVVAEQGLRIVLKKWACLVQLGFRSKSLTVR
jgi:hypothetical protein